MVNPSQRAVPTTVTASFWLWIASVVISLIAVVILLATGAYMVADVGGNEAVAQAVAPIATIIGAFVGAALRVLFAVFMLRGRNWARIVLLILAILTALGSIATIATGGVLGIIAMLVTIVAAVLMYVPASNPYFRRA